MLDPSIPVTAHAVLRYMTRVLKLKLTGLSRRRFRLSNAQLVCEAVRLYGLDAAALQRAICPPGLESAVRGGARRIRKHDYCLICQDGRVVTVIEKTARPSRAGGGADRQGRQLRHDRGRMERRRRAGAGGA